MVKIQSEKTNWIPEAFQRSAQTIAKDAVKRFVKNNQVIGLGSGPMAAAIVKEIGKISSDMKKTLQCIASSTQIKQEALQCFRSEEHTSELQSRFDLVCRLLLEKKKIERRLQRTTQNAWRS